MTNKDPLSYRTLLGLIALRQNKGDPGTDIETKSRGESCVQRPPDPDDDWETAARGERVGLMIL